MGAQGLSDRTGVDLETAKELMQRYFATYRGVAVYLKRAGREALQRGYAVTLSGRRRYYPVGGSELSAKNHPIQGTNADILKRALTLLYERLPGDVAVVLTIHDEIVLECPEAKIEEAAGILQECMLDACRDFLKAVTIPTPDVLVADYWQKD
jgi:DNA polymerase-1